MSASPRPAASPYDSQGLLMRTARLALAVSQRLWPGLVEVAHFFSADLRPR